jgi:hypothetical protein
MTKTFLGVPIEGDIVSPGRERVNQRPKEELGPLLAAVLNHPKIDSVRWHQYTPYFNDGDPCEFGVGEPYVKLVDGPEDGGDYEDGYFGGYDDELRSLVGYSKYDRNGKDRTETIIPGSDSSLSESWRQLSSALNSGVFENALLDLFGDHAEVTVHKDKIVVGEYSHE